MEIIQLSGYTEFEKLNIAERYLVPRQKKECGLDDVPVELTENAVRTIIHHYTKEAGVRSLEREIATVCRKVAREVVAKKQRSDDRRRCSAGRRVRRSACRVTSARTASARAQGGRERDRARDGLAVTMHGGDLLATRGVGRRRQGQARDHGLLGEGMEESAQAAMSYVRSRAPSLGLERDFYRRSTSTFTSRGCDPQGRSVRRRHDGTGLVSALLRVPGAPRPRDDRRDHAARARAAIGGLKEKLLAAHRAGITTVLIPKENEKDLRDIPKRVLKTLQVMPVEHMDDVLRARPGHPRRRDVPEGALGAGRLAAAAGAAR